MSTVLHCGHLARSTLVATLVLCGAVVPGAAATGGATTHPETCFPPDGVEFVIGTEGPQIELVLHLSLLPALVGGAEREAVAGAHEAATPAGALGVEAAATTGDAPVVSLRAGVLFEGGTDLARLVSRPFAPFALAFDYAFTVPAFAGTPADGDYRESDVPVSGPVEEAACSA